MKLKQLKFRYKLEKLDSALFIDLIFKKVKQTQEYHTPKALLSIISTDFV